MNRARAVGRTERLGKGVIYLVPVANKSNPAATVAIVCLPMTNPVNYAKKYDVRVCTLAA